MSGYTKANLKTEVEDAAPKFGLSPGLEFRYGQRALELEQTGASYMKIAPSFRQPFGHVHGAQEEVYIVVSGSVRVKLDDDIVELGPFDTVRIGPGVTRCVEGGPEGAELILFGAPKLDGDAEVIQGWWTSSES
jgi:mannose-6-phosphate isomerase-like protein (cupin superfamily)